MGTVTKMKTWTIELVCVGMQFRWKKEGRQMLARNTPFPVVLEREPDNKADANAIKVMLGGQKFKTLTTRHLGYLRRGTAELLAPKLDDKSLEQVKLWVTHVDVMSGEATIGARFRDVKKGTAGKKPRTKKRPPGAP